MSRGFRVVEPGLLASVQDLGRPGYARLGVSRGGAADRGALRLANRLVGNAEDAAGIEVTAGGFSGYAESPLLVAVTGALAPVHVDDRPASTNAPLSLAAGARLAIGRPTAGLRNYVAIAGGVTSEITLRSRSYSRLGGLGAALAPDDLVPIGTGASASPVVDHAAIPSPPVDATTLAALPGPRRHWFSDEAVAQLMATTYRVTAELDRTGIRLDGPAVPRCREEELPSEGMVRGAVQIPASGRPIIFLSDHPATGGYPVPLVLTPDAADHAAQLTPGMTMRFALE
ncbi:MAG: biotin-dependent carboxyltransferase family protein [Tetrasphaera sp.]|nr:biotin-dependent carboxyltransferase family protein [Tetrasphaera sp.]